MQSARRADEAAREREALRAQLQAGDAELKRLSERVAADESLIAHKQDTLLHGAAECGADVQYSRSRRASGHAASPGRRGREGW